MSIPRRLRVREEEWERQTESRVRATEARLAHELQEKEELFQSKSRQRDEQWQLKFDGVLAEFSSPVEAVRCAVVVQEALTAKDFQNPSQALRLRKRGAREPSPAPRNPA